MKWPGNVSLTQVMPPAKISPGNYTSKQIVWCSHQGDFGKEIKQLFRKALGMSESHVSPLPEVDYFIVKSSTFMVTFAWFHCVHNSCILWNERTNQNVMTVLACIIILRKALRNIFENALNFNDKYQLCSKFLLLNGITMREAASMPTSLLPKSNYIAVRSIMKRNLMALRVPGNRDFGYCSLTYI